MRLVAFDTETHLIQPGLLAPPLVCGSWAEDNETGGITAGMDLAEPTLDVLERLLRDPDVEIAGANIPYDFAVAAVQRPSLLPLIFQAYDAGRVFCVLVAEALIDIHEGILFTDPVTRQRFERYSLLICAARHLGLDLEAEKKAPDAWRLRYAELDGLPLDQWPEAARVYPLHDAEHTLQVAQAQKRIGLNLHNMAEQARAAWALHLAAVWGIRTDPVVVAEVVAEIEKGHEEAIARFAAIGFVAEGGKKNTGVIKRAVAVAYGANPAVPCAVCQGTAKVPSTKTKNLIQCAACDATGIDLGPCTSPRTDSGKLSTAEDTLKESGDPQLEGLAETGENAKNWTTYRPIILQGVTVPINPETNVLVVTGRASYRKPNLTNQPRKGRIRECYVPRPGHLMASVDYSTVELCTLAQVCLWWVGHSTMADAINEGQDLHARFAARVAGVTYAELKARLKAKDKQAKNFRQMAKAANFGLPGGLGAAKLVLYARQAYDARFCELSGKVAEGECGREKVVDPRSGKAVCAQCLAVAKELKGQWFEAWPEIAEYHAAITVLTDGPVGGMVQVPGPEGDGKPGLGIIRGGCGFCDGANNGFQGLAARGGKAALYRVSREAYTDPSSALWGTRPLVFIHDEILAEVPEATAHEAAHRVSDVMVEAMREFVPDVKIAAPPALMHRWLKGAEPTYQCPQHGLQVEPSEVCCELRRLIPWEPPAPKSKS